MPDVIQQPFIHPPINPTSIYPSRISWWHHAHMRASRYMPSSHHQHQQITQSEKKSIKKKIKYQNSGKKITSIILCHHSITTTANSTAYPMDHPLVGHYSIIEERKRKKEISRRCNSCVSLNIPSAPPLWRRCEHSQTISIYLA